MIGLATAGSLADAGGGADGVDHDGVVGDGGQALSPTAIAKTLDRSAGAVANALGVLASQGGVVLTQTKPRRYAIATAEGGDHAKPQR